MLSREKKLAAAFDKYQTTKNTIDLVANLGFGELSEKEAKKFPSMCTKLLTEHIGAGLTMDDTLSLIRESGLDSHRHKFPQQATLQLISTNHELRGYRFVYRQYKTLAF
jgi:hypothetical protein